MKGLSSLVAFIAVSYLSSDLLGFQIEITYSIIFLFVALLLGFIILMGGTIPPFLVPFVSLSLSIYIYIYK